MRNATKITLATFAGCGGLIVLVVLGVTLLVVNWSCRAASVASKEVDPAAIQRKYEWFKDAAAQLDRKRADIAAYEARLKALADDYEGKPRTAWAREDREQRNLWLSEAAGLKSSYNDLAAQYNAAHAKWNWRFADVGDLPKGAASPLPRNFKPYIDK